MDLILDLFTFACTAMGVLFFVLYLTDKSEPTDKEKGERPQ